MLGAWALDVQSFANINAVTFSNFAGTVIKCVVGLCVCVFARFSRLLLSCSYEGRHVLNHFDVVMDAVRFDKCGMAISSIDGSMTLTNVGFQSCGLAARFVGTTSIDGACVTFL